jgi:ectoine hydroxylase-related dioxygenase (phytanoyl-CoA dioxygenase family)
MDRASFKPPFRNEWPTRRDDSPFHWDRDPLDPSGSFVQGLLYLTDTAAEQGVFQCAPRIHRSPHQWALSGNRAGFLVPKEEIDESEIVRVPGRAGTLILWDSRLPHRGGLNYTDNPRFAQAIAMHPVGHDNERQERIRQWYDKRVPSWWRPWPNQIDPEPAAPARLSELGRKLVGLDEC